MSTTFAQISDCHLFADPNACHVGENVYQNLCRVLRDINARNDVQFIIFTGDLTQDHSAASYQLFAQAYRECIEGKILYFLAGNHDDPELMTRFLNGSGFSIERSITVENWQVQLVDTKTDTPAGRWHNSEEKRLHAVMDSDKKQILFMHHHVKNVGYFIDRHNVVNASAFVEFAKKQQNIAAIACGHVHNAMTLMLGDIPLYTCPATSIQFDKQAKTVANSQLPAAYRLFSIENNDVLTTQIITI